MLKGKIVPLTELMDNPPTKPELRMEEPLVMKGPLTIAEWMAWSPTALNGGTHEPSRR